MLYWQDWKTIVVSGIEIAGVIVIVGGGLAATARALFVHRAAGMDDVYRAYRRDLGRAILLGLEFLVAADIVNTVALDPSLSSVAVLGAIVVIRTFLSFSLEVEISGQWPWQRASSGDP